MELNDRHKMILDTLDHMLDWATTVKGEDGYLSKSSFAKEFEPELAHLLERGFIKFGESNRFTGAYVITKQGQDELSNMNTPDYEARQILATIARLESELAAARARLAPRVGELRGVNGALSDGLHEGG